MSLRRIFFQFIFSFVSLVVLANQAFSQTGNFAYFGVEQGLPQSSVKSIIQDKQGNLWAGTSSGVSKYNGFSFINFSKKDGLAEDRVTASCVDREGNIWFGHWGGGLSRYLIKENKMEAVPFRNFMLNKPVSVICEDSKGVLWLGTEGLGLIKFSPNDSLHVKIYGQKDGLFSKNIFSILEDKSGVLWLGTDIGITKYFPETQKFEKVYNNLLPSEEIRTLFQDHSGQVWIGTRDSGLVKVSFKEKAEIFHRITRKDGLPDMNISSICEGRDHAIWVGTNSGGMVRFDAERNTELRTFNTSRGLASNQILSLLCDREGSIWAGTFLGLEQFSREDFELFSLKNDVESGLVWDIVPFDENSFLLGTENGLVKFNPKDLRRDHVFEKIGEIHERVNAVIITGTEKTIWASVWGKGLCKLSADEKKMQWLKMDPVLAVHYINSIAADKSNHLWLGVQKGGAIKIDCRTLAVDAYGISQGFHSNSVQAVFCDHKGEMWFGTSGGYLTKYDGVKFYTYSEKEGLNNNFILCMNEDNAGNLYCGAYGGGLYRFDGKSFTHLSSKQTETPFSIIFDRAQNLWIGTSTGAGIVSQGESKGSDSKNQELGFSGIEVNPNAVCVDSEGVLWYGTLSGVVKYMPSGFRKNSEEPMTRISDLQVFFKSVPLTKSIKFSYDENYVSIFFEGVSLKDPSKILYSYKLSGIDKKWSPPIRENYINYPNLPPGNYTFQVKACNNDGLWNEVPVSFAFSIKTPYWLTWWFRILALNLIAMLAVFIFMWRVKIIRKNEIQKTELNKKIANIELRALLAQMNPHFIFNTMNSIQHFVMKNDSDSAQKYLAKFAELIRTILDNSRLSYIQLSDELKSLKLYMELEALRFENKFTYEVTLDPLLANEHVEIPTMLIQPYLENAIVHGLMNKKGEGKISLKVEKQGEILKCSVEDNGIGRKRARELRDSNKPKHKSVGMAITSERLEILNIMNQSNLSVQIIDLEDANGNPLGTRVELYIPLGNPGD